MKRQSAVQGTPMGRCPCGKRVSVLNDERGNPIGVSHDLPQCAKFNSMEPPDFLKWMNDTLGVPPLPEN